MKPLSLSRSLLWKTSTANVWKSTSWGGLYISPWSLTVLPLKSPPPNRYWTRGLQWFPWPSLFCWGIQTCSVADFVHSRWWCVVQNYKSTKKKPSWQTWSCRMIHFRYICYIYYQKKLLNVGKHIYNMWILWGQLSHIGKSRPMSLWLFEVLCGGKRGVCFVAGRRWPIALMMLLLLMEENPANQLRLVVFPIIYKVL